MFLFFQIDCLMTFFPVHLHIARCDITVVNGFNDQHPLDDKIFTNNLAVGQSHCKCDSLNMVCL